MTPEQIIAILIVQVTYGLMCASIGYNLGLKKGRASRETK